MSKILIFPFELAAHYLRCINLINKLDLKESSLFCESNRYSKFIKNQNIKTFKCKSLNSKKVIECIKQFSFEWLNEKDLEEIILSQIETIEKYKPKFVIGDAIPTLKIACEYTNTKYINLTNTYISKYYSVQRPVPSSHPAKKYQEKISKEIFDKIAKYAEIFMFYKIHKPFKNIRKKLSLKKINNYLSEIEGDYNILCDSPELFPHNKLPENYLIISPLFYQDNNPEKEIINWLNKSNKKNILISMGSTGSFEKLSFLNDDIFKEYNFIIAGNDEGLLNGSNFYKKNFINNMAILPKIDLMICHGGNGTIYQALINQIAILAMPTIFEQEYNIEALKANNFGDYLDTNQEKKLIKKQINFWINKRKTKIIIKDCNDQLKKLSFILK